MRERMNNSSSLMMRLEQEEQQKTGINSLKVGYNHVHGYYIEITKTHLASVPERYVRYQTLVGKERYTTVELKQLEAHVVAARMESITLENTLFETIKREVDMHVPQLRKMAQALAHLDALMAFAHNAYQYGYV
jgi:DNA mismatch repair protein MutS